MKNNEVRFDVTMCKLEKRLGLPVVKNYYEKMKKDYAIEVQLFRERLIMEQLERECGLFTPMVDILERYSLFNNVFKHSKKVIKEMEKEGVISFRDYISLTNSLLDLFNHYHDAMFEMQTKFFDGTL